MAVPRMTLEAFARERGLLTTADVQGHIHAGLRSAPTTKTYARWNAKETRRLQDARDATVAAYRAAIEAGEIAEPEELPRLERLRLAAEGDPLMASTQAARRLLAKLGACP